MAWRWVLHPIPSLAACCLVPPVALPRLLHCYCFQAGMRPPPVPSPPCRIPSLPPPPGSVRTQVARLLDRLKSSLRVKLQLSNLQVIRSARCVLPTYVTYCYM